MNTKPAISFENTEYAFAYKKNADLKKARFLFSLMGTQWLVNLGLKITPIAIKWNLPFTKSIIQKTIFHQFVGGETLEETYPVAKKLGEYNVQVILDYGVEGGDDGEIGFDHSTEEFIRVINYASTQPNIPFTKSIIQKTIFHQFVGGETLEETYPVAKKLGEYNVQVILDYGVEGGDDGEMGFDHSTEEFIRVINYASTQPNIPFMSIKVTGFSRFALLEKIDNLMHKADGTLMKRYLKALDLLTDAEKEEWHRVRLRMFSICEIAQEKNVGVLVDAEETWIQDPVDALTILMMDILNKDRVVVYNTLQLYRTDRLKFLKDSYEAAAERNFILGAKLVRGAYMENERQRAANMNYPSPIQPDKESCDKDYNAAIEFSLAHADRIALIVASHNDYSNLCTIQILDEKGLPHNHPHVHFSQLYGMSDNITFNLARGGCSVSKYLPFGPIKDVVPYLMRRAEENSSLSGQTGRELGLIKKELKRRAK